MRKFGHLLFALGIAILSLAAAPANAATTTFVAGMGSDLNPCTIAQPCFTFFHAISIAGDGGEVRCLDGGPYATTTFTGVSASTTIDCPGTLHSSGAFIYFLLDGGTSQVVKIRNATFDGAQGGGPAIVVAGGATLILENCIIQNYNAGNAIGIQYLPRSPGAQLILTDTVFSNNGIAPSLGGGLQVAPQAGGSAGVVLDHVKFEYNVTAMVLSSDSGSIGANMKDSLVTSSRSNGILSLAGSTINFIIDHSSLTNNVGNALQSSGANSVVFLNDSTIFGNQTGVSAVSGRSVLSYKNNRINGNQTDGTPLNAVPGVTGSLQ